MDGSLAAGEEFASFDGRGAKAGIGAPTMRGLSAGRVGRNSERGPENERESTPPDHQRNLGEA